MRCLLTSALIQGFALVAAAEAWYVPGWMRTQKAEGGAWSSFTNALSAAETRFWSWDGDRLWPTAVANADDAVTRLVCEIAVMPEERRANLTLVGHSLGGRLIVRALNRLGAHGLAIKQGILLAPAIPHDDPEVERMGRGSRLPVLLITNPKDVTLKYVYALAGGEGGRALGADGTPGELVNVEQHAVRKTITDETVIADAWGRFDVVKRIANHHAAFYFAELGRILDGEPSPDEQVRVPQGKVNVEWKVIDAGLWWDVLAEDRGWKLERNIITRHCRILDSKKHRVAWGDEVRMRESFESVRHQIRQRDRELRSP